MSDDVEDIDASDLPTTLALTEAVSRMRGAGKPIDKVIATLRASTASMIDGLRVEVINDVLAKGPADMKLLCARALEMGCTLHAAQVQKILTEAIEHGAVKFHEEPTGRSRPRTVYELTEETPP